MALLTPPGMVPDEPAHMTRAAGLLRGELLGTRSLENIPGRLEPTPELNLKINPGYFTIAVGHYTLIDGRTVVTAADVAQNEKVPWSNQVFPFHTSNTATYFPAFYVPASAALAVGRLAHASPFQCFLLARLGMLFAFLTLGYCSLAFADGGEAILFTTLLLPMTLFLAGSLNEDGVIIAAACLAAAALRRGQGGPKARVLGIVLLILVVAAKPPYLPMLGLLLLPLRRQGFIKRLSQMAVAAAPALIWVAVIGIFCAVPFDRAPYHPGPLWDGDSSNVIDLTDPAANARILLAHPTLLLSLPWQYILTDGQQKLKEAVGILGTLSVNLDDWCYRFWGWAVGIAALALIVSNSKSDLDDTSRSERLLKAVYVLAILALTGWAVMISMYVNWTNVGHDAIDGIQGRYLLVLLPFTILFAPVLRTRLRFAPLIAVIPTIMLAFADLGYLPQVLTAFFYVH
jgi:hypothetical protein